jgi:hypothetical protein
VLFRSNRPNDQNDWLQGYCYQFWRCTHNGFRGDGAFGQYTIVLPEQDAVIAITSESNDMQGELDLVWKHLLPAMKDTPLPADQASVNKLHQALSSLALKLPQGRVSSPVPGQISGRTFKIQSNELNLQSVSFVFRRDSCLATVRDNEAEYAIQCGLGRWQRGETALPGTPPRLVSGGAPKSGTPSKLAASGAWKDENTFEMMWRYYETPHHDTMTCCFDGDNVTIGFMNSIAQMGSNPKDKRPTLHGQLLDR